MIHAEIPSDMTLEQFTALAMREPELPLDTTVEQLVK